MYGASIVNIPRLITWETILCSSYLQDSNDFPTILFSLHEAAVILSF